MTLTLAAETVHSQPPVTVLTLDGELDASNYLMTIERVRQLYQEGVRHLVLDLSDLSFMASSGLVALHCAALLMHGEPLPDLEEGWRTLHSVAYEVESRPAPDPNLKLLNPQPRVRRTLELSGFNRILEIFDSRDDALASFQGN